MSIRELNKRRKEKSNRANAAVSFRKRLQLQEKTIFDLKQLLEISKSLNSMIDFSRLMEAILYVVMAQMKTFGVAIFTKSTFDDETFVLYQDVYGFEIDTNKTYAINENHKFLTYLTSKDSCFSPEEVKAAFNDVSDESMQAILSMDASLFVPLKAKRHVVGFLLLGKQIEGTRSYDAYEQEIILSIANLAAIAVSNAQLLDMSTTDMMTHLKLKHYFFAFLNEKLENLDSESKLSVIMFDIDNFKKVNDTYGHACGDVVLQQVAGIIKTSVRNTDLAARYGGEEFVVALLDAGVDTASVIAERVRSRVENMEVIYDDKSIKITISSGIAEYIHDDETTKSLVNRSDEALYVSKRTGKNKYSISEKNLSALDQTNTDTVDQPEI